jgi:hypothetical protein
VFFDACSRFPMSVLSLIRLRQTALAAFLTVGLAACAAQPSQPTAPAAIDTSLGQLPTRAAATPLPSATATAPAATVAAATPASADADAALASQLIGVWQAAPSLGAGWAESYQFWPDGAYTFHASQMDCAAAERGFSGAWRVSAGVLLLAVAERQVIEGGELVPALGSCGTAEELQGGTLVSQPVEPAGAIELPLGPPTQDSSSPYLSMRLGEIQYWRFSDDPAAYP